MVVLVLDDNLLSSTTVLNQLRLSGHEPVVAKSLSEALTAAAQRRPQFLLVNLGAATFDPLAFIRAVRADSRLQTCSLVGFCGHLEHARHAQAREAGCHHIITNAQALQHLAATLATLE